MREMSASMIHLYDVNNISYLKALKCLLCVFLYFKDGKLYFDHVGCDFVYFKDLTVNKKTFLLKMYSSDIESIWTLHGFKPLLVNCYVTCKKMN